MTDQQPPRKTLSLTKKPPVNPDPLQTSQDPPKVASLNKKRVVIVDPLQTSTGYSSPPPQQQQQQRQQPPKPQKPKLNLAPKPQKKKKKHVRPDHPPDDFDVHHIRNSDESYWAQQLKKKKTEADIKKWRESNISVTTVYSEETKLGKYGIFKVLPHKLGAYFVSLHDTIEKAQAEAVRIRDKIHSKDRDLEFSLFITQICGEIFYSKEVFTQNGFVETSAETAVQHSTHIEQPVII